MQTIQTITVFCGSRDALPVHRAAAADLGRLLAARGITLVFGGSDCGTMKTLADAALDAGGRVIGITTARLAPHHPASPRLTQTVTLPDLSARKAEMIRRADAIIALPGGYGTWDELFDALTLLKTGQTSAPVGVLNTARYYDKLLSFIADAAPAGFIRPRDAGLLLSSETPDGLLARLEAARAAAQSPHPACPTK